ncbi:MAG: FKBP-type peptidyl-prolyl cis-trans isomerase [Candidatus Aenigmarchaeota archaeon]|nr:FKBP-type peptidyl-prolyl cis-trans isomerase [Candidatus Aenigmarchaeota archaeon]
MDYKILSFIVVLALLAAGCTGQGEKKAVSGDTVSVFYTGKLDGGTVFDSNVGKEALKFKIGEGQVIKGFEDAVVGLKVGETKIVRIPAEKAYGNRDEKLVIEQELVNGTQIELKLPRQPSAVEKINDTYVKVDYNPKFAGQALNFEIRLFSIE